MSNYCENCRVLADENVELRAQLHEAREEIRSPFQQRLDALRINDQLAAYVLHSRPCERMRADRIRFNEALTLPLPCSCGLNTVLERAGLTRGVVGREHDGELPW